MRLPILFIVFLATIGGIFLFENTGGPAQIKEHTDIVEALKNPLEETPLPSTSLEKQIQPRLPVATPISSTNPVGYVFYTSSHSRSKYYYCDTDSAWKSLSADYLKSFNSETELLKHYDRILHEPC